MQTFIIECKTNLHAGAGGEAQAIIDKPVQRDVTTGFPTIFSSSLKGAIREWFNHLALKTIDIEHIFGTEPQANRTDPKQGEYRFFNATLLSIPVRSNLRPFYNASCPSLLLEFLDSCGDVLTDDQKTQFKAASKLVKTTVYDQSSVILEDFPAEFVNNTNQLNALKSFLGANPAILTDEQFIQLSKQLPVIARNQLEDGTSNNLWYEEIVPRCARFFTQIQIPEMDPFETKFIDQLKKDRIQIGGNATIGYGQCEFLHFPNIPKKTVITVKA